MELQHIDTNYGEAQLAVKFDKRGDQMSYSGSVSLNPTQKLADTLNEMIREQAGLHYTQSGASIENGQFKFTAQNLLASGAASIQLKGERVEIQINEAKLLGLIPVRGLARNLVTGVMSKFHAEPIGRTGLSIPLQELARQSLGDELVNQVRLSAQQDASGIRLDFATR